MALLFNPEFGGAGMLCIFFFQAEDGIRDVAVTGVQTCALPIWRQEELDDADVGRNRVGVHGARVFRLDVAAEHRATSGVSRRASSAERATGFSKIGRASCRERV